MNPKLKLDRLCTPIKAERLTPILFENIPNIVIYCVCFGYFFSCTVTLVQRYLQYDTTVLIKYEQQHTMVKFPSFTICGCSSKRVVCGQEDDDEVIEDEMALYSQYSVMQLLNNVSFRQADLVVHCDYIFDSRRPDVKMDCSHLEPVVESLHNGRKCFTFLTMLHDGHQWSVSEIQNNITRNGDNTSYIDLQINLSEAVGLTQSQYLKSIQDFNVYLALHPSEMIPEQADAEVLRLEVGMKYDLHFGKQVTKKLEPPYITMCRNYSKTEKPRSQYECMRLCMLRASFRHNNHSCINNYNLVTSSWLEYLFSQERIPHHSHHSSSHHPPPTASSVHYCTNQSDRSFAMHIRNRRSCIAECHQPDCLSESYSFVTESSGKGAEYDKVNKTNVKNSTHVTIWPDRKMYEVVQHYKEIDIFQLIGALGGNSHLFLGLSAIQLYDVVCRLIRRTRGLYQQII